MNAPPPQPNPDNSDDMLMKQVAAGSKDAFRTLLLRHQDRVTRVACRLLSGNLASAEDVAQEAFLRVWRGASTYQPQGTFTAYLLRITRNLCEDARRRSRTDSTYLVAPLCTDTLPPDVAVTGSVLGEAVRCAVDALPDGQREVFILSHYENLSYREIADILVCPMGTVASRKYHAIESLRHTLRDWQENAS